MKVKSLKFIKDIPFQNRKIFYKSLVLLILIIGLIVLFIYNGQVFKENKRMLRFVTNKIKINQKYSLLQTDQKNINTYLVKIDNESELENLKTKYLNKLIALLRSNNLKVDSYNATINNQDGFIVFQNNIVFIGDYPKIVRFFLNLKGKDFYYFIKSYNMNNTTQTSIRVELSLDVLGRIKNEVK